MKKVILLTFLLAGTITGHSQSIILNHWRDPNTTIVNPGIHKIVVAALIYDQGVRHQVEDYMVSLYPGVATQSYLILGGDSLLTNEEGEAGNMKNKGYDGIVILKQVNENTTQQYIPGQMPTYYNTWNGYWGYGGWGGPRWRTVMVNPGTPGHVQNQWNWFVQVNVFSLVTNKLLWSANTKTTNPGGRIPLLEDGCNAARSQMTDEGFLL